MPSVLHWAGHSSHVLQWSGILQKKDGKKVRVKSRAERRNAVFWAWHRHELTVAICIGPAQA